MRLSSETDAAEGLGYRLYRSAEEIRADMRRISEAIRDTQERMDVRDLIVSAVSETEDPKRLLPLLEQIVAEANEARDRLETLEEDLSALRGELEESRCFWL